MLQHVYEMRVGHLLYLFFFSRYSSITETGVAVAAMFDSVTVSSLHVGTLLLRGVYYCFEVCSRLACIFLCIMIDSYVC